MLEYEAKLIIIPVSEFQFIDVPLDYKEDEGIEIKLGIKNGKHFAYNRSNRKK